MNYAIILASGKGERAGGNIPKQFIEIKGKTILEYTISAFEKNKKTDKIILVVNEEWVEFCTKFNFSKLYKVVKGGPRRQDSSKIGVDLVEEDDAKVLIHDGARPFVTDKIIDNCYDALNFYNAVDTGIEATDTTVQVDENRILTNILDRKTLIRCQTPQGFKSGLIKKAHKMALEKNFEVTDDVSLIVKLNLDKVYVVEGSEKNLKITYKDDIKLLN